MDRNRELVRQFLEESISIDDFWDLDAITWVDWRDYDEDIIDYVNEKIGNFIEVSHQDNKKEYGDDIIISYKGKSLMIPYGDVMDRDTTIIYINELIKGDFEIRLFVENLGSDTLGFIILDKDSWEKFEEEFAFRTSRYFMSIDQNSRLFELKLGEATEYISLCEKNPNVKSQIILEFMRLNLEKDELWEQRQEGKVDLKTYVAKKKELEEKISGFDLKIRR